MTVEELMAQAEAGAWLEQAKQLLETYGPKVVEDVGVLQTKGFSIDFALKLLQDFGPLIVNLMARLKALGFEPRKVFGAAPGEQSGQSVKMAEVVKQWQAENGLDKIV